MNIWIKSLAALSLLTGPICFTSPAEAAPVPAPPAAALPAPAPAQDALSALIARPDSPLPPGTKLLAIRLTGDLATVNFSHELRDNFTGGDSGETRTVNAILSTLGRFPTISRVQLLIEGKRVDSIGGLLTLSDPLPVLRAIPDAATAPTSHRWLHRKPLAPATGTGKTHAL